MEKPVPHPYLQALREPLNLAALLAAAGLAVVFQHPAPALLVLGLETAYLAFLPRSRWYRTCLEGRVQAAADRKRERLKQQLLPELRPEMQDRYTRLEEIRDHLAGREAVRQTWLPNVVRKVDSLLERFLSFAATEAEYRNYLLSLVHENRVEELARGSGPRVPRHHVEVTGEREGKRKLRVVLAETPPRGAVNPHLDAADRWAEEMVDEIQRDYREEMDRLEARIAAEANPDTRELLEKRLTILQRRWEGMEKIGRVLVNLNHQLCLLEDAVALVGDEVRACAPDQIIQDIEEVVLHTDAMTRLMEDLAPYQRTIARMETMEKQELRNARA